MKKLILVVAALALAGCSSMGSLKAGHSEPVQCLGIVEVSTLNREYTIQLQGKKVNKYGEVFYQTKGYSPFVGGTSWTREDAFSNIICNN